MESKSMGNEIKHRVELGLHTTYSEDISLITPAAAVRAAAPLGLKAIAITDKNSVQSFYDVAYCGRKFAKELKIIYGAELSSVEATVLVKTPAGLKPLYKLLSGKAITPEERKHLLFGANVHSPLQQAACEDTDRETLCRLAEGYDYITLESGNAAANQRLYALGKDLGIPVVAVGNCHHLRSEQRIAKDILHQAKGLSVPAEDTHLCTAEEMLSRYAYLGETAAFEVVITNPCQLADAIDRVDPTIKRPSFTLRDAAKAVGQLCENKLETLYPAQPSLRQRLARELSLMEEETVSMFLLCYKIVAQVKEKKGLTGLRGTVGSTLVAWLLGISDVNPLPAHYRCPACKYTEFAEAEDGFDLPQKACPHCGKPMVGDGHNIPFESCLGVDGTGYYGIDLNMSEAMRSEAKQFLADLLGKDRLAAAGTINTYLQRAATSYVQKYADQIDDALCEDEIIDLIVGVKRCDGIHPAGILLLPEGMDWEDVTPLRPNEDAVCKFASHFEHYQLMGFLPKLNISATDYYGQLEELFVLTHTTPEDISYQDPKVYELFYHDALCGIPEFSTRFSRELLSQLDTVGFSDLVKVCGMAHGTNAWTENGENLIKEHPLRDLIAHREDVFNTLIKHGVDRETAYKAMSATRKGRFSQYEALARDLAAAGMPEWYLNSMEKVGYLFPKAHGVHYCKLAYMFAWFKVYYPEAFYKVVLKYTYTAPYEGCTISELQALLAYTSPYDHSKSQQWETLCFLLEAHYKGYFKPD